MIELFALNRAAYDAAVSMLSKYGKAAVVHPTGTGKSFIGFKLCEEMPEKRVLWLSPSEYIFRTQLENLGAAGGETPRNLTFCTYARLSGLGTEELLDLDPQQIVLDEFHRCGAEVWGRGVKRLLETFPEVPVLGLSATAIRYLDNRRDMADELFDGCVASEMTLGEAIVRGILNPPKYVTTLYAYQKDLERYARRVRGLRSPAQRDIAQQALEALRRALDKAEGLDVIFRKHMTDPHGKYIVFCANKAHMDEMMGHREWFKLVDEAPRVYSVYSEDPGASRSFDDFRQDESNDHLRLLYCIDALNEGIHVEGVDGVILLRPTVSPILYKQQIGRALSACKAKEPVIFDVVMNIENLCSIDTVREEMRVALTYYRSLGDEAVVNERFTVLDELRDCRELFERLNDTLTASWDAMYGEAEKYYRTHGDLEVPKRHKTPEGYSLGTWLDTQRKVYRGEQYGALGPKRIESLERIGMVWDGAAEKNWKKYFAAAQRYRAEHGDLNVPVGYVTPEGTPLGRWLKNLRAYRKSGCRSRYLSEEHMAALNGLGMIWDVPDYQWEQNFAAAMEYHREHGDLAIPYDYVTPEGIRLGVWLNNMRCAKQGKRVGYKLTAEQEERLSALGMVWGDRSERLWEQGIRSAKRYARAHGHLHVPAGYVDAEGFRLGSWIANRRAEQSEGRLSESRRKSLEALGITWRKDPWEKRFALAERYYREHGDLWIPAGLVTEGVNLCKWLNEQKQAYRGKRAQRLSPEQIRRLEGIGIDWRDRKDALWERRYEAVRAYCDRCDGAEIPGDVVLSDGTRLSGWLSAQRRSLREGKLTPEQLKKLADLGVAWTGTVAANTRERARVQR